MQEGDPGAYMDDGVHLHLRLTLAGGVRLGPGKIRLLEAIAESGSISQAAREMLMSYRRAWLLVNSVNQGLGEPVVTSRSGGSRGGGARVTQAGHRVIALYRAMERKARDAAGEELEALAGLARSGHHGEG